MEESSLLGSLVPALHLAKDCACACRGAGKCTASDLCVCVCASFKGNLWLLGGRNPWCEGY